MKYIRNFIIFLIMFSIGLVLIFSYFFTCLNEISEVSETQTKLELKLIDNKLQFVPVKDLPHLTKYSNFEEEASEPQKKEVRKPFCKDKKILPVWRLLINDQYFKLQSGEMSREPNCAKMFEILRFDLNQDGKKELILRAKVSDLCGGTGNCGFWIFQKKGKKYRKILNASDYVDITKMGEQISREKTNGFHNITLKGHFSASDTIYSTFKFNGSIYAEKKCVVDFYIRGTNPDPKWKFITCKKFFKFIETEH